ncbi:hypothetical protein M407DRAFT_19191 [Tulasnella calospora MUT 4182]|uniref:glutathione transferase n=1 Tax=Tulasnella calospora MUT 4182 TaxID=1051891 RepID=A0A0C3LDC6_9AGAM|nr:hypothetical protein M407DRAFT_19191 [Tulasnella calospora MUT 4182]
MTITLHYLNNSRAQRILWLLEELEVPYEVKRYERVNLLAPPEFYQVHPLGKSPVITDGDLTIAESGAIVEYVLAKYGKGRFQAEESGWLDNLYFLHYAEGTLMPLLAWKLILTKTPDYTPITIQPIAKEICKNLIANIVDNRIVDNINLIEEKLKKHPGGWFAGGSEPTAADFMMLFPMEVFASRSPKPVPESFNAYVKMIHDRPAYKRALEKGGSYAYAQL